MKLSQSYENYLETIYIIQKQNGEVHSVDIANHLSFTKPSVSVAMKNLKNSGYIEMDGHGHITLREEGLAVALEMYRRHELLSSWLIHLGVEPKIAYEDACRIEHVISQESFDAVLKHVESAPK